MIEKKTNDELQTDAIDAGIVMPEEILEAFEIERIEEMEEECAFHMLEKENGRPDADGDLLKDGYYL